MAKIVLGRGLGALIQARPAGTSKSHVAASLRDEPAASAETSGTMRFFTYAGVKR